MNDQHTEAVDALTPLTKRRTDGMRLSLLDWASYGAMEQDPSDHYRSYRTGFQSLV